MLEKIKKLAKVYSEEFIEIRHHIHSNPELSFLEFETSAFIQEKLSQFNIPCEVMATTGVVGLIEAKTHQKSWHCELIWMHCRSGRKMK